MKLSRSETLLLGELRRRIEARFGDRVEGVTLFGSRARGEGHEDSDLDVLVLVRDLTAGERRALIDDAFDLEMAWGIAVGLLVRDSRRPLGAALAAEIRHDGVTL